MQSALGPTIIVWAAKAAKQALHNVGHARWDWNHSVVLVTSHQMKKDVTQALDLYLLSPARSTVPKLL